MVLPLVCFELGENDADLARAGVWIELYRTTVQLSFICLVCNTPMMLCMWMSKENKNKIGYI